MNSSWIKIEGDKEFKELMSQVSKALEAQAMRAIARKGGNVVKKAARVQIPGYLGSQIKKDIGVVSDRRNKSGVVVKLKNKYYPGRNGDQRVVSSIARHMTEGAKQNTRKTKSGKYRGRVVNKFPDFIQEAGQANRSQVMDVMQKESIKVMEKTVRKYGKKR
jgi:hypothetical protein